MLQITASNIWNYDIFMHILDSNQIAMLRNEVRWCVGCILGNIIEEKLDYDSRPTIVNSVKMTTCHNYWQHFIYIFMLTKIHRYTHTCMLHVQIYST